jgi:hypothetical protein
VDVLYAVSQHRAVDLAQNVLADLDDVARPYADDALVVRGVVDLAQRQAVGDDRSPPSASAVMWAAASSSGCCSLQMAQARS